MKTVTFGGSNLYLRNEVTAMNTMEILTLLLVIIEIINIANKKK